MKTWITLFFLVLFGTNFAQEFETAVFEEDIKKAFKTSPKLDVKLDTRFSFIASSNIRTTGIKVGLSFNRQFKMGLGYNRLFTPTIFNVQLDDARRDVDLAFEYFSPYFEYIYFSDRKWEFNIATQLGIGRTFFSYNGTDGKVRTEHTPIYSYEPSMLIDYKIVPWVGIGSGIGYRLVFYKNPKISEQMTSPVFVLKAKIYLGEIVRTFTGKEIQAE